MTHPYLIDMAIHHVDMLRMITGQEIAEVDARAWRVPDSPFEREPTVEALLALADGTPVAYEGTFAAARSETSWNGDWELVGTEARATWTGGVQNPLRGTVALERYGRPPRRVSPPVLPALDRVGVLEELRRAVHDGVAPEVSAADNVRTFAAVLAIARSIDERRPGRAVKLGLFLALFHDRPLGEALAAARAPAVRRSRSRPPVRTAARTWPPQRPRTALRSRRSPATRTRCTPTARSPRGPTAISATRCVAPRAPASRPSSRSPAARATPRRRSGRTG